VAKDILDPKAHKQARMDKTFTVLLKVFLRYPSFDTLVELTDDEVVINRKLIYGIFDKDSQLVRMVPRYFLYKDNTPGILMHDKS
jgi:hypothetical protein